MFYIVDKSQVCYIVRVCAEQLNSCEAAHTSPSVLSLTSVPAVVWAIVVVLMAVIAFWLGAADLATASGEK